jgi:hypothetical protein
MRRTYERAEKGRRDFAISGPILMQMLVDDDEVSITFSVCMDLQYM